jgi:hypothetical protein
MRCGTHTYKLPKSTGDGDKSMTHRQVRVYQAGVPPCVDDLTDSGSDHL